jgi:hypothetical protein
LSIVAEDSACSFSDTQIFKPTWAVHRKPLSAAVSPLGLRPQQLLPSLPLVSMEAGDSDSYLPPRPSRVPDFRAATDDDETPSSSLHHHMMDPRRRNPQPQPHASLSSAHDAPVPLGAQQVRRWRRETAS